jgi:hypothetical protein
VKQNDFPDGELRWTCGHADTSNTIEIANGLTPTGIVGVSGPSLYKDGTKIGEQTGSSSAVVDTNFIIGCITTDGNNETQFMKGTIKKVLIVNRRLTDDEQAQIYSNITGAAVYYEPLTDDTGNVLTDEHGDELTI